MCFGGDNLILIDALYNVTGKNTHLKVETHQDKGNGFFVPCHLLIGSQEFVRFGAPKNRGNDLLYIYWDPNWIFAHALLPIGQMEPTSFSVGHFNHLMNPGISRNFDYE